MKRCILGLLLLVTLSCFSEDNIPDLPSAADDTLQTSTSYVQSAPTTGCVKWKTMCYQKTYCTNRSGHRTGCYRCVNMNQNGFHLYPREMERTSCNLVTVDYLRTMGYRCYRPYNTGPCLHTVQKQICDAACDD